MIQICSSHYPVLLDVSITVVQLGESVSGSAFVSAVNCRGAFDVTGAVTRSRVSETARELTRISGMPAVRFSIYEFGVS